MTGVVGADRWLVPQSAAAATLDLVRVVGELPTRASVIDALHADLGLIEGVWIQASAESETVTFTSMRPLDDAELIHPFLAPAASLHWIWRGRETLHAGAVLIGEGAVVLVGDREAGKSTTLAALAGAGYTILTDDLVVVSPELTMPVGPRSIDRRAGAELLGESVRNGQRDRLTLNQLATEGEVPIKAVVHLGWGDALAMTELDTQEKLSTLARARRVRSLDSDPRGLLELVTLPAYRLVRPRRLMQLAATLELLTKTFA